VQTYAEARLSDREGRAHWRALFDAVKARRLMAPSLPRTLLKLAALLPLLGATLWLAWFGGSWAAAGAGYVGLALVLAQFAFVGHDAGHGSVSARGALNRALGQAAMTLVTGLAFDEWIGRHRAHHQFCQDEARDPDMAVALVVSLTERSRRAKGPLGRWLTRQQWLHIWLLSLFFGHSQRLLSQAAVLAHPRRFRLDGAMLGLHFGLWFGLPLALGAPFAAALLAYLVPLTLLGPYLAAIFWVNHIGMPLVDEPESFSFFEHQAATSRTIVNPPGWDWLFGGLNFQVEHHLFPQVPSDRLGALHGIVRAHFARAGLAYNAATWPEAVAAVARHLRRVARAA
jgi:fatty acid desaturase